MSIKLALLATAVAAAPLAEYQKLFTEFVVTHGKVYESEQLLGRFQVCHPEPFLRRSVGVFEKTHGLYFFI
jgi:hypothetical protein